MLRPGGFVITDKALEICKIAKGGKCLEIGCGSGDTTERLEKKYGFDVVAIDNSLEMVEKAKEKKLKAHVAYGDGEFLDGYKSCTFDLVVMECVLSLINMADEALHETYCVLKKGGKLFISDVYAKNIHREQIATNTKKAEAESNRQREYKECSDGEAKEMPVSFRLEGVLILEELKKTLEDIGFENIYIEDRTRDLEGYVAEEIMAGRRAEIGKNGRGIGYFMLIAKKPEEADNRR